MMNTILLILIVLITGFIASFYYINTKENEQHPVSINVYEQLALQGVDVKKLLNSFIENQFNIFILKRLDYYSKIDAKIQYLSDKLSEVEYTENLVSGFVLTVKKEISNDLMSVFYLEYKREERSFDAYLTRWFLYRIKRLVSSYAILKTNSNNTREIEKINNLMYLDIESNIFDYLGINKKIEKKEGDKK